MGSIIRKLYSTKSPTETPLYNNIISNSGEYKIYDGFKVGNLCHQSYPCKHEVIIDNKMYIMNGREIYDFFHKKNIPIPKHYDKYR